MRVYVHDGLDLRVPESEAALLERRAQLIRLEAMRAEMDGEVLAVDAFTTASGAVQFTTARLCAYRPPRRQGEREPWASDPEAWRR